MASGKCGTDLTWTLDGDLNGYTLTISGTGDMWNGSKNQSGDIRNIWSNCDQMHLVEKVFIEHGVTSIGAESVTYIGKGAFCNCQNLTSITIPNSVTYISEQAFLGCSGLKSIVISDSVTYIESEAFAYCENLESIIIPDFVKSIGEKIFCGCSSLKKIYYPFGLIGKLHEGNHDKRLF